jgi:hypothetical protein
VGSIARESKLDGYLLRIVTASLGVAMRVLVAGIQDVRELE